MKKICLNMIVKNEAPVIQRCLASVRPWISHWVIVDTGSTDGTQDLVRAALADIPGELYERPWQDFAHNRNEALDLARRHGDYILFIDADETLKMPEGFGWGDLGGDGYRFRCELDGWQYQRNALVSARQPWRWEGVLHEYLTQDGPHAWRDLPGPVIQVARDGARARDPDTYLHDIAVLERAVAAEPENTRYRFYLAQSYRDSGQAEAAIRCYRQRVEMGGWDEECWYALFQIAVLTEKTAAPVSQVRDAYLTAYEARPKRAEPLCELARYHRLRREFAQAHLFAQQAVALPIPADTLFVDTSVYLWRALDELTVSSFYVGALQQGRQALQKLIQENRFPDNEKQRILGNRVHYGLA